MAKSLLEQLPEIVANGRKVAEKILENLEGRHRVGLQTREWVLPSKDTAAQDWITANERHRHLNPPLPLGEGRGEGREVGSNWHNRLIYGDNLLAMAALLAGDDSTPSLRGKVDLIYIDPPFDSKADYRTKITLPSPKSKSPHPNLLPQGEGTLEPLALRESTPEGMKGRGEGSIEIEQKPTVIEQFAYSDTWADGTASYLAMITPRLILMRELLSDTGFIYVHLDWHVGHYVKLVLDEVFGREQFRNEVIWQKFGAHDDANRFGNITESIFFYSKSPLYKFTTLHVPFDDEYVAERYIVEEDTGRLFYPNTFTGKGDGSPRKFRGLLMYPPKGRHWAQTQENIDRLENEGDFITQKMVLLTTKAI